MGGNLTFPLFFWILILIGLFVVLWTDKIPDHIFLVIICVWLGVGLILIGLNEISRQLNRYDNLKLTQLEKIKEEMPELEKIRQELEGIEGTLGRIETQLWDLMKHWED